MVCAPFVVIPSGGGGNGPCGLPTCYKCIGTSCTVCTSTTDTACIFSTNVCGSGCGGVVGGGACSDPLKLGCTYNIPNTYLAAGFFVLLMMLKK